MIELKVKESAVRESRLLTHPRELTAGSGEMIPRVGEITLTAPAHVAPAPTLTDLTECWNLIIHWE